MAENLMAKQFRGGEKGFLESHYAVWQNGLGEHVPNIRATKTGVRNAMSMLKNKSTHGNSSYQQLLSHLQKIQQKEENKERTFLLQELGRVSQEFVDIDLKNQIHTAIDNGDFGIAYTLITRRKDNLQSLRKEINSSHFQSPQKMNSFYNAQFFKYLEKRLNATLGIRDGELYKKIDLSTTINDIVDEWINDCLFDSSGVSTDSLLFISEITKDGLVNFFTKAGISVNRNSSLFDIDYNALGGSKIVKEVATKKRKKGGSGKTKKVKIGDIVEAIYRGTYKGLSTELMALAEQGKKGTATFSTGNLEKEITNELTKSKYTVQQKADLLSIIIYESSVDLGEMADDLYGAYTKKTGDKIDNIIDELSRSIDVLDNIFVIETNVKGYLSYDNLKIEQKGNFALRMNNLAKMGDIFPAKTADRLIFLLVNTFDECIASHKIPMLEQYFAAAIAAWMWDDYDQFFNINEQTTIQRVRMFKSGSMYYSASQIMKQGISDLEKDLRTDKKDSFIDVSIVPPNFNAESVYERLVNSNDTKLTATMSEEEVQLTLEKRWNYMRDLIMKQGEMSISLNQKKLDEMLGNLKDYV